MGLIRLSKSTITNEDKNAVLSALDKEYLGMGSEVNLFESELRSFINTQYEIVCVNTGTSALHLALQCAGIGIGDEVLVPSITYVASFQAISATGAKPVACDILPDSLFIDVHDAEKRITPRTKAIMPVHYASNSSPISDVYECAKRYGLRVVEDAAHSFGSYRNNKLIGSEGDIICFSFDGIKNITSGEGGALISSDAELIKKAQDARLLGVERDTEKRYSGQRSWEFDVKQQGYRYHMSNIMAALGRSQLRRIDKVRTKRQSLAKRYVEAFESMRNIRFLKLDYDNIIPHIFVIRVLEGKRNALRRYLAEQNIETGIHYFPNHLLTLYKTSYLLPQSEDAYSTILSLPMQLDISDEQQNYIIDNVRSFIE